MTERKALGDAMETPEDVATLYSWANLHGAKYRDFSVARAQTREKARLRVQEAIDEERERTRSQAEPQRTEPPTRPSGGAPLSGAPLSGGTPLSVEQSQLAELANQLAAQ